LVFGSSVQLDPPVNGPDDDYTPCVSADGLTLIFASTRPGGEGSDDLWMSMRKEESESFGAPENLGPDVNSTDWDAWPTLSGDGLTLVFASPRNGNDDLWMSTRESRDQPFLRPVNLTDVNSETADGFPQLSADGLTLVFASQRPGGLGDLPLWKSTRTSDRVRFGPPVYMGAKVILSGGDGEPRLSQDELTFLFQSGRTGGQGGADVWMLRRDQQGNDFGPPQNLGAAVNSPLDDKYAYLAADGRTLYFASNRSGGSGGWDIYESKLASPSAASRTRFGLDFDGKAAHVEVPSLKLQAGTDEPLTLEAYVRPRSDEPMTIVAQRGPPFVQLEQNFQKWSFVVADADGIRTTTSESDVELGRRVHLAGVWDGQQLSLYVDGKLQPHRAPKAPLPPDFPTGGLSIGWLGADYAGEAWRFDGVIDGVRISNSARYKGDKLQPPESFKRDADTLALYLFEEAAGDELRDASGHNHHGKIVGAKWVEAAASPLAAAPPKGEKITPEDGWVDVLSLVDPALDRQTNGSIWAKTRDGYRNVAQKFARIAVPVRPLGDYELRAQFMRVRGVETPNFHLPVAGRQVLFVVDGWGGKGLSGLQSIGDKEEPDPTRNEGFGDFQMKNDVLCTLTVSVSTKDDQATIVARLEGGGQSAEMTWTGAVTELGLKDQGFALADGRMLGLGAWESIVEFQKLELRMQTGEANLARPPDVTP
jgi:hypothetical protein